MTSPYLTLPSRGEEEARAQIAAQCDHPDRDVSYRETGDYDESKIARCSACGHEWIAEHRAQIGEKAQGAFLKVVQTASELTTEGLPPGKTVAEAIQRAVAKRDALWRSDLDEDERIDELTKFTTRLYGGNELAGKLLASLAIWS